MAAQVVQQVVTDGWKVTVAGQLSDALNNGFWKSVPRGSRGRKPECKRLAYLADAMEEAKKTAHDAVSAIADKGMTLLRRPTP
jgi:hypothetical protein